MTARAVIFAGLCGMAAALSGAGLAAAPPSFEAQVLGELNALRADPPGYSRSIAATRARFDGMILRGRNRGEIDIRTSEGVAAVDEAVAALRAATPVPTLEAGPVLTRAAADLVAEQSRSGGLGHRENGRGPAQRVVARGGGPYVGEVITYGHADPASVIEQLVVGDGVPGRGHRTSVLRPDYRYAGVGCGAHPVHRRMCVILLSPTADGTRPPPPVRPAAKR
ncbi:MAG TPA: CAP domain-containing protein [Sphingopyxis sp.]|nr:CAP domain-containing protein [Sphingopyxis sp.]HMP45894.1 CAP domain-containing protein [Sphingopyxis sp.]